MSGAPAPPRRVSLLSDESRRLIARALGRSNARKAAWAIIQDYAKTVGKICFTYDRIQEFRQERYAEAMHSETLSRRIRELVENGLLDRVEFKGQTWFCINRRIAWELGLLKPKRLQEQEQGKCESNGAGSHDRG